MMNALLLIFVSYFLLSEAANRLLCFHSNHAGERGTEVAMYDYAEFSEIFWGYQTHIIFPNLPQATQGLSLPRFQKRFNVSFYNVVPRSIFQGGPELVKLAKTLHCDWFYMIKAGKKHDAPAYTTTFVPKSIPMVVHAVFHYEEHGDGYAAISPDATDGVPGRNIVYHMVRPVDMIAFQALKGLREELSIPSSSLVICRYGGKDSFDVAFAQHAVWDLIEQYNKSQLHFVFMNTDPFYPRDRSKFIHNHPQIHHVAATVDIHRKEQFIRTCNAMLHARIIGESFGLSVAEFSAHGLPVITFPGTSQEHIHILGDKGFIFANETTLKHIVTQFVEHGIPKRDYNAYRNFTPDIVMQQFKHHFLDPIFHDSR
jgi:hypothetical protein